MRLIKLLRYFVQIITWKIRNKNIAEIVFTAVTDFGGVYIKLIQFICLRTNIIPESEKLRFLSFYDEAPIETIPIRDFLNSELGQEKSSQISYIAERPFASGTFGQVYRATLINGEDIIVKVKRKNLISKLRVDFFVLRLFARIFDLLVEQKIIDLQKTLHEFEQSTYQELDYEIEAKNADYFFKQLKGHPRIFIPKTYVQMCTKNVLVQEYVGGIAVTDLIRFNTEHPGIYKNWLKEHYHTDPYIIYTNIVYDLAMQGLHEGIFYADPHPGNIKILPNNRYAYIDFGIVGVSPENRLLYYKLVSAITKKASEMDMQEMGEVFLEWGAKSFMQHLEIFDEYFSDEKHPVKEMIVKRYKAILESKRDAFSAFDEEENFFQLCFDIVASGTLLNVRVPEGFLASLKTMIVFKSWVAYLEPEYHFMRQTYKRIIADVNPQKLNVSKSEIQPTPETALEVLLDWSEQIAETDMPFQQKLNKQILPNLYV